MERVELRLVGPREGVAERAAPGAAWLLALLVLGAAGAATLSGADAARREEDPAVQAEQAIERSFTTGVDDPEVRATLVDLRRALGRRPLDSHARVVYASLLLALGRSLDDTRAAAFHAGRAAALAPVTVPVVRSAALVLARTGEEVEALDLTRRMFEYDPEAAARLLARVEFLMLGEPVEQGLAERPEAWLAWSHELRKSRRAEEADAWLSRTTERWPDWLPAAEELASHLVRARDWEALGRLLGPDRPLPEGPQSAVLLVHRSRLSAARGEPEAARADVDRAVSLAGERRHVQILAGEAYEALGDGAAARRQWERALFELPADEIVPRRMLFLFLARLEDREGSPAAALRRWQALLALDPEHAEARRRVDDLSGFTR